MVAAHAGRSPLAPRSLDGVGKAGARECDANSASAMRDSALVGWGRGAAGARVTAQGRLGRGLWVRRAVRTAPRITTSAPVADRSGGGERAGVHTLARVAPRRGRHTFGTTCNGLHVWKVYFSDFTGGIHTDLRILPVDFTSGIQAEAFVDLPGSGLPKMEAPSGKNCPGDSSLP